MKTDGQGEAKEKPFTLIITNVLSLNSLIFLVWQNQRSSSSSVWGTRQRPYRMSQIYSNASVIIDDENSIILNRNRGRKKISSTTRKTSTQNKTFAKSFFLRKHVFSNSISRCYSAQETKEGRIFNEKVIWSIYFKVVRLFTEIACERNFLCQIWILFFSVIKSIVDSFSLSCASARGAREKSGKCKCGNKINHSMKLKLF